MPNDVFILLEKIKWETRLASLINGLLLQCHCRSTVYRINHMYRDWKNIKSGQIFPLRISILDNNGIQFKAPQMPKYLRVEMMFL